MNSNYKVLNLAAQKAENVSHYTVFKSLAELKKKPVIEQGSLETELYCFDCTVTANVLGVVRRHEKSIVVLIVNFSDSEVTVDVRIWLNILEQLSVYTASVDSKLDSGSSINMASFTVPGSASVVLATKDLIK